MTFYLSKASRGECFIWEILLRFSEVGLFHFPIHYFLVSWDLVQNPFLLNSLWLINSQARRNATVVGTGSRGFRETPCLLDVNGKAHKIVCIDMHGVFCTLNLRMKRETGGVCSMRGYNGTTTGPQPRFYCYRKEGILLILGIEHWLQHK